MSENTNEPLGYAAFLANLDWAADVVAGWSDEKRRANSSGFPRPHYEEYGV